MSPLAAHYTEANLANDHARNCGWGAGADCDCSRNDVRVYVVTIQLSGGQLVLSYFYDQGRAVEFARSAADKSYPGVKVTGRTYRPSEDDGLARFYLRAHIDMERIRDWQTD